VGALCPAASSVGAVMALSCGAGVSPGVGRATGGTSCGAAGHPSVARSR